MYEKIKGTTEFIRSKSSLRPETGIVLGTGLGGLAERIEEECSIPYDQIPDFPVSTVSGHSGRLILRTLAGTPVVALQGRFHYSEGYDMQTLTFPIRVMIELGIGKIFLSNASGGVNPEHEIGDIMLIEDHINLLPSNPLIGPNDERIGPRFLDMSKVYDEELLEQARRVAKSKEVEVKSGIYAAISGPCFETPAEYRYIRRIGADAIGMSTIPEAITARHMGVRVFAVSVITDLGVEGKIHEVSHEEVKKEASKVEHRMTGIIEGMLGS
jgi:purine-nucleoside phosphorylase